MQGRAKKSFKYFFTRLLSNKNLLNLFVFQVFALFNNVAYVIGTYFLYLDWKSNPAGTNAPQPTVWFCFATTENHFYINIKLILIKIKDYSSFYIIQVIFFCLVTL